MGIQCEFVKVYIESLCNAKGERDGCDKEI